MPRLLRQSDYWTRVRASLKRGRGVQWVSRPMATPFYDAFPEVPGTIPEKLIFNELARRRINFYFNIFFGDLPFTPDKKERYRPDFLLPDYRIIIEPQGVYWHTLPGKYDTDALRAAMLIAAGYKVYQFTDTEILADVKAAIDTIPELINPTILGDTRIIGSQPFDPLASIKQWRARQPKRVPARFRDTGKTRIAKTLSVRGAKPVPKPKSQEPLFAIKQFSEEYIQRLRDFGQEWRQYLASLGSYFREYPEAIDIYPEYYDYWRRWRNWWDRFKL